MLRFSGFLTRCAEGYAWENRGGRRPAEGKGQDASRLVLAPNSGTFENIFDPFDFEPALFRIFASLPPTPDAIVAFANQYGDLWRRDADALGGRTSLSTWRSEISAFREQVEAADRIIARSTSRSASPKQLHLTAEFIESLLLAIPVFMSVETQGGVLGLRAHVFDLKDVIHLQLVEAVIERKRYRTCDLCGKPFELTPQVNRSDRIFCSDNCRVKAYQRRRKQAVAMRAKKMSIREIAKSLNSDVPTVKKWVGEAKKEE
jgi:hypothetical protein